MATVVFDLDGTLVDTSGDLIAAANACFHEMGHGTLLIPVEDTAKAFRGARAMLREGLQRAGVDFDESLIDEWYPRLLRHYEDKIDFFSTPYPGAYDALKHLRGCGYRLSICTNKPEGLARKLMQRLNMADLFHGLVGADTLPVRKPDPAPYFKAVSDAGGGAGASVLVGDTDTDFMTAKRAGVPCVLVTFGADGEKVREMVPKAVMNDFGELVGLITEILGPPSGPAKD